MLKRVFPKPQINHQQWLDARCQIYSRIKNKGFPLKLHKSAKKGKEKVKNSRQIWESWIPPVVFWKLDNHTKGSETSPMMKTKQAKNQNHPLPERSSQFTQTAFPHKQGKNISDVEHLGARNPKWRKDITRSS